MKVKPQILSGSVAMVDGRPAGGFTHRIRRSPTSSSPHQKPTALPTKREAVNAHSIYDQPFKEQ